MLSAELDRRNAQAGHWGVFAGTYKDEGLSGKNLGRPALQQLLTDIESGKISAVFFTELSRLSRSLKDFINIFEFMQRNGCDLVCLKTEIDTTSPYSSMITKILMVFAEFEREITAERTAIHAYERAKRGLANGGACLLGYRRHKLNKGRLTVDREGAKIVRDVFAQYASGSSLRKVRDLINDSYEELQSKIPRITTSRIHSILTNKAYVGIREIYKKDRNNVEEVPAAWPAIIEATLFEKVSKRLAANRERFRRDSRRYTYSLSGLIRCSQCGELFQGKSAYSHTGKRHNYYAHKTSCRKNGLNSIDATDTHQLIFREITKIQGNPKTLAVLLRQTAGKMTEEVLHLRKKQKDQVAAMKVITHKLEGRISQLSKNNSTELHRVIEESILSMEKERARILDQQQRTESRLEDLEQRLQLSDPGANLFTKPNSPFSFEDISNLIQEIELSPTSIKTKVRSVNHTPDPLRTVLTCSRNRTERNTEIPLFELEIPLPGQLLLRNKSHLRTLAQKECLSQHEIARRLKVSRGGVRDALQRFGLVKKEKPGGRHPGQIPFGWDWKESRLVKNAGEQKVIRWIGQMRKAGKSLNGIAKVLNESNVQTKNGGSWQANTVRKILSKGRPK